MGNQMSDDEIRQMVREQYAQVARALGNPAVNVEDCCGPQGAGSCCAPQESINTENCCGPQSAGSCCSPVNTASQAIGFALNGNEVVSNRVTTGFRINDNQLEFIPEAQAVFKEEETGEVLSAANQTCPADEHILPYVLLFILSSLWLVDRNRRLVKVLN